MSGVRFGPLEIYVNCDAPRCGAQVLMWSGDPESHTAADNEKLPPGWTWRAGKTYCTKHSS